MHPCHHAKTMGYKPAIIMGGSGETISYQMLNATSNQIAHALRANGFTPSSTIAIFAENSARYFEITWAAQRSGIYYVCISSRLTASEVAYILQDSGAELLIASHTLGSVAIEAAHEANISKCWAIDGDIDGFERLERLCESFPQTPIADEMAGLDMLYSSGTTGRPKGIRGQWSPDIPIDNPDALSMILQSLCAATSEGIYLSPAPLYHAAPLRWCMSAMRLGMTLIIMEKFDPEQYLQLVEKHKITHTQLVPTMFVRMLKLPEAVRSQYDISSLIAAIHAAAPCPVPIKEQMISWWGEVIFEYYAGSEGNGLTWINSQDWLTHKGSVGKAVMSEVHICDEAGNELPNGEAGQVYFSGMATPNYHNAPDKTQAALNPKNPAWSSLGDVGYVDAEGFLYLTDRKAFMIISGGVNIYPQEAENVLITHPSVADCAVFGVPDPEFGEAVKAVIQPMEGIEPSEELAETLIAFCQNQLSKIKCPKSIDFDPELPRHPTGKLYKRLIRDRYWGQMDSKIV